MRDYTPEAFAELPEMTMDHLSDIARLNLKVFFFKILSFFFFPEHFHLNMLSPQVAFNLIILIQPAFYLQIWL